MSVVNKMLTDLEKREGEPTQHANYQPSEQKSTPKVLWIIIAVLLVGAIAAVIIFGNKPVQDATYQAADTVKPIGQALPEPVEQAITEIVDEPEVQDSIAHAQNQLAPESAQPEQNPVQAVVLNETQDSEPDVLYGKSEEANLIPKQGPLPEQDEVEQQGSLTVSTDSSFANAPSYRVLVADALAQNQPEEALLLLQQWVATEPENLQARKKLASVLFSNGRFTEAEQTLLVARRLAENDASVRLMQGRLYTQVGRTDKAFEALQLVTEDTELLYFRAALAREINNLDAAWRDYRQLSQLDPLAVKSWLGLAVVSESMARSSAAIEAYTQVMQLAQGNTEIQQFAQGRLAALRDVG